MNMLDCSELNIMHVASSSGRRAKARSSRQEALTSRKIVITHKPTDISVSGEVEEGHYSRKQMQKSAAELQKALMEKLEKLVAKKMKSKE
ncbi:MAG: hypothetical protein AAFW68_03280 [Pseudomonadota bacterium]